MQIAVDREGHPWENGCTVGGGARPLLKRRRRRGSGALIFGLLSSDVGEGEWEKDAAFDLSTKERRSADDRPCSLMIVLSSRQFHAA